MTKEEAINTLGNFKRYISGGGVTDLKANEAIDMAIESLQKERGMNHDATHCADFCVDCPMRCYRAELEVDLRKRWIEFIGIPLSYSHFYGTDECIRNGKRSEE